MLLQLWLLVWFSSLTHSAKCIPRNIFSLPQSWYGHWFVTADIDMLSFFQQTVSDSAVIQTYKILLLHKISGKWNNLTEVIKVFFKFWHLAATTLATTPEFPKHQLKELSVYLLPNVFHPLTDVIHLTTTNVVADWCNFIVKLWKLLIWFHCFFFTKIVKPASILNYTTC